MILLLLLFLLLLFPNIHKTHQKMYKKARNVDMWDGQRDQF